MDAAPQTYFEVVAGNWDGGYVEAYAHATAQGALDRAEKRRENRTAPRGGWVPMKPAVNEDGYEQVGWELGKECYVYVGERVMHA